MLDIHGHSQRQGVFIYGCLPDKRQLKMPLKLILDENQILINDLYQKLSFDQTDKLEIPNDSNSNLRLSSPNLSTLHILPKKSSTKRDIIAWRVKLLPRMFDASIQDFSIKSCSFKMHRTKSQTMRM